MRKRDAKGAIIASNVIDAKSTIVFTQEVGTIFSTYDKDILTENYFILDLVILPENLIANESRIYTKRY